MFSDSRRAIFYRDGDGSTLLTKGRYDFCMPPMQHTPEDIFIQVIEIGGRYLVMVKNQKDWFRTVLHYACMENVL